MLELMLPAAVVAAVGYTVLRRSKRPLGERGKTPAVPLSRGPTWQDAAPESDMLRIGVDQMRDHRDLVVQSADAWLMNVNQQAVDPQQFHRNVQESEGMVRALDDECEAVVAELRDFERKRTQTQAFAERRERAEALSAWAMMHQADLERRLDAAAASAGLDAKTLKAAAVKLPHAKTLADVEALLPRFADPAHVALRSILP